MYVTNKMVDFLHGVSFFLRAYSRCTDMMRLHAYHNTYTRVGMHGILGKQYTERGFLFYVVSTNCVQQIL